MESGEEATNAGGASGQRTLRAMSTVWSSDGREMCSRLTEGMMQGVQGAKRLSRMRSRAQIAHSLAGRDSPHRSRAGESAAGTVPADGSWPFPPVLAPRRMGGRRRRCAGFHQVSIVRDTVKRPSLRIWPIKLEGSGSARPITVEEEEGENSAHAPRHWSPNTGAWHGSQHLITQTTGLNSARRFLSNSCVPTPPLPPAPTLPACRRLLPWNPDQAYCH